jgi:hypothetical protein
MGAAGFTHRREIRPHAVRERNASCDERPPKSGEVVYPRSEQMRIVSRVFCLRANSRSRGRWEIAD